MKFLISANTDVGIKKETNQDSTLMRKYNTDYGEVILAVVCDGMGGLSKGEVASASVINAFSNWAKKTIPCLKGDNIINSIQDEWNKLIVDMNEKIMNYGKKNNVALGTTVSAIIIIKGKYCIVNVGDTRIYEITDKNIDLITKDHTLVQMEIDKGELTEQQAEADPRRSVLTQCCGASKVVYPDFFSNDVKENRVFLICTDGFRHEITKDEIFNAFNPEILVDEDVMNYNSKMLIELNKNRHEKDNITVGLIRTI